LVKEAEERCPEYVTTGTVAEHCGVSKVTVLRWIEKGHLIAFRLPEGHHRIHRDDFDKFLAKHGMPSHKGNDSGKTGGERCKFKSYG